MFVGKDVATALGYAKPENAIATHVDTDDKTTTLIQGTGSNYKSKVVIINESGLYALILSSKLPQAKTFKRWAPNNENNTAAYIRHVSDYTGIGPDKVLASPKECPIDWLLIGYAMAVVENGKALPAAPMLKGYALAMG